MSLGARIIGSEVDRAEAYRELQPIRWYKTRAKGLPRPAYPLLMSLGQSQGESLLSQCARCVSPGMADVEEG